jgi:hypothetical protein
MIVTSSSLRFENRATACLAYTGYHARSEGGRRCI